MICDVISSKPITTIEMLITKTDGFSMCLDTGDPFLSSLTSVVSSHRNLSLQAKCWITKTDEFSMCLDTGDPFLSSLISTVAVSISVVSSHRNLSLQAKCWITKTDEFSMCLDTGDPFLASLICTNRLMVISVITISGDYCSCKKGN
ncbi:hypothetical protein AVEN_136630-1 [Araneus ventricosus]|uniref:Uncharacterized protein n=1 Tax=Araneus ventricosus TaxID=182803 RepID=A0A4Y2CCL6_ARAVE|nr:hypothetical protein AVEN_136630-1 [Araneus ventricosus]